jgi:hypothetical protein
MCIAAQYKPKEPAAVAVTLLQNQVVRLKMANWAKTCSVCVCTRAWSWGLFSL